ncbi:MAG: UDP-glucose 4-epimerase GalE [Ktedonobacteraceae bacterium]
MRVMVTGGTGYIGSHTVQQLKKEGHVVVVYDSMEFGSKRAVGDTILVEGDTANEALLEQTFHDYHIEAVIHMAAYKAVGESVAQPYKYFKNNVSGTLSLLEAMHRANVKYIVFSSSAAVYGTPDVIPVSETNAVHPESPYGESKRMVEQLLSWYDKCHGLRSVSLRYFNAAGASLDASIGEDWTYSQNLIPWVMKAALGKIPALQVFGTDYPTPDGTAIRDYIHILDLADAHVKALHFLQTQNRSEIFNLGVGKGTSVQEIYDTTKRISGLPIPVEYVARRAGDPVAVWADNSKAKEMLGWQPQYTLEDIIRTAWQWYLQQYGNKPAGKR